MPRLRVCWGGRGVEWILSFGEIEEQTEKRKAAEGLSVERNKGDDLWSQLARAKACVSRRVSPVKFWVKATSASLL